MKVQFEKCGSDIWSNLQLNCRSDITDMLCLIELPKYHTLSHIKEQVVPSQLQVFMFIIHLKPYLKFRTSNFRWHDLKTACSQQQLIVYLNTSCCFLLCAACTVNTMEMSMLNFDLCLLQQCISMTRSSTLWSC